MSSTVFFFVCCSVDFIRNDSGAYFVALATNATNSSTLDEYSTSVNDEAKCVCSLHSVGVGGVHSCTSYPRSVASTRTTDDLAHPVGPSRRRVRGNPSSHSHALSASSFFGGTVSSATVCGAYFSHSEGTAADVVPAVRELSARSLMVAYNGKRQIHVRLRLRESNARRGCDVNE